ncbi:class I SAM-dependent DNA methyltransferase [Chloroflexota bacterium]
MGSFDRYAEYYDLIYDDKDYEKECDFIEEVFRRFSPNPIKTVLEGGCGTGGHAIPLARRDYLVTGIDSSDTMLVRAKVKAADANLSLDFHLGNLQHFDLGKKFDSCLCMFAVMGYITETANLLETLKSIRKHLHRFSLFVFDFWNGLAVLRILPTVRLKLVQNKSLRIIRIGEPELDSFNHLCRVHFRLLVNEGNALIDEIVETHVMRYYFPQEITHYLEESGFEVLRFCPFPDIDGRVDENTWNSVIIAQAV